MDKAQAYKFVLDLLRAMVQKNASDLFLTVGFPPALKIDGKIQPVSSQKLEQPHADAFARSIMNEKQIAEFERTNECNFAIAPLEVGRFRVNAFVQQGRTGLVLRVINTTIPQFDDLGLPPVLRDVAMTKRGLITLAMVRPFL